MRSLPGAQDATRLLAGIDGSDIIQPPLPASTRCIRQDMTSSAAAAPAHSHNNSSS
jgi:hypothetical protein